MSDESIWTSWVCPTCDRTWRGGRPRSHLCPDGTLYISASSLSRMVCDLQAWLAAQGASQVSDNAPAFAGQCVHLALATYYRTWDAEEAKQVFLDEYRPFSDLHVDPNGPLARLTYENTSKILAEWLRRYTIDSSGVLFTSQGNPYVQVFPDLVEVPFQLPLSEEHRIVVIGILDALVQEIKTGMWFVKDHKSTGSLDKRFWAKWQLDAQPICYEWSAIETTGKPIMGLIINGLEFSKLAGADLNRKCYLHKAPYRECQPAHVKVDMVQYDYEPPAVANWHREAVRIAREYRQLLLVYPDLQYAEKLRSQGQFRGACRDCFASAYCAGNRQQELDKVFQFSEGMIGWE